MFLQQFKRSKVEGPFVPIVVSLAHGDFEHNDTEEQQMAVSQVRVASRVWIYPVISLQMTLMFCEAPSEQLGHPNGLCFEPY